MEQVRDTEFYLSGSDGYEAVKNASFDREPRMIFRIGYVNDYGENQGIRRDLKDYVSVVEGTVLQELRYREGNSMEEFVILDRSYLPEMAELYKSTFMREPWNDDWSDEEQLMEYVKEKSGGLRAVNYGLLIDGKLAAVSMGQITHWWEGTNYVLDELCVSPDLQGKGIGTRFMSMIESDLRSRNVKGIFLQTDTDKPSYRFYQKNGFKDLSKHVSLFKGF